MDNLEDQEQGDNILQLFLWLIKIYDRETENDDDDFLILFQEADKSADECSSCTVCYYIMIGVLLMMISFLAFCWELIGYDLEFWCGGECS